VPESLQNFRPLRFPTERWPAAIVLVRFVCVIRVPMCPVRRVPCGDRRVPCVSRLPNCGSPDVFDSYSVTNTRQTRVRTGQTRAKKHGSEHPDRRLHYVYRAYNHTRPIESNEMSVSGALVDVR